MTEQEKEMFLDNYRKSKGWSVEDEQRIIKNIKDSGIVEKIKNLNEKLERMMYESRNIS